MKGSTWLAWLEHWALCGACGTVGVGEDTGTGSMAGGRCGHEASRRSWSLSLAWPMIRRVSGDELFCLKNLVGGIFFLKPSPWDTNIDVRETH